MTNYKEILRLYYGGYSQRAISISLSCSRDTVSLCITRAKEREIKLPIPENVTNEELKDMLHNTLQGVRNPNYLLPNFENLEAELKRPHVTNGLLWMEYLVQCKNSGLQPYSISQFNTLLREYSQKMNISLRQDHRPGEVLELDWSGSSILLSNRLSDDTIACHLFVAAFPFSGYFYVEAFSDEKIHSWVAGIVHALSFFKGVPLILRPDNLKTAIIKADKYEPILNTAMTELAEHYRTAVIPARIRAPRDKNVVEGTVGYVSRQILASLRNQKFFSIDEMNNCIWQLMDQLNATEFKKKDGSRSILFLEKEQLELLPLPPKPFELFERVKATVAYDYHIEFAKAFYSVSPSLVKSEVLIKASSDRVLIYDKKGTCVAEHSRCRFKGQRSTLPQHVHDKHADYLMWSSDYFLSKARKIGSSTEKMITHILQSREYEVQTYRSCVGILHLEDKYGSFLEHACKQALESGLHSYKAVNTIIKTLKESSTISQRPFDEDATEKDSLNSLYCIHELGGNHDETI
ncbi:MAG: IS21 family transposase [Bacteroidales bacterium]|jgi:transposase|nr:IS21 family transposase [Bacteroidales bacterium]